MPIRHLRHLWSIVTYSLGAIGPRRLVTRLGAYSADAAARSADSGFDARFGTDTTTGLTPAEAALPASRRRGATMYLPSMDGDLDAMLTALAWPDERLRAATFIDVGSGKGGALFLAAMRPFRAARGVELSPVLHAIAERNLAIMRDRRALAAPVELELGDATALSVPPGPLMVYLYHPFREPIAAQVIDRVVAAVAAHPRPAAILYGHPTLQRPLDDDVFCRGGLFRRQHAGARVTRRFRIGWSIWSNHDWLADGARGDLTIHPISGAAVPADRGTARATGPTWDAAVSPIVRKRHPGVTSSVPARVAAGPTAGHRGGGSGAGAGRCRR